MRIIRDFIHCSDRYNFDNGMCSISKGYAQVDTEQDASDYGTWTNPRTLTTISYVEGDIITRQSIDTEEYVQDLRDLRRWNFEHGWTFHGIDYGIGVEGAALKQEFIKLGLTDLFHEATASARGG